MKYRTKNIWVDLHESLFTLKNLVYIFSALSLFRCQNKLQLVASTQTNDKQI